jgi:hypothetical protein
MVSVADCLRDEDRRNERAMTSGARVALALALGRRDLETFRAARGVDVATARGLLDRRRQRGRRPSACIAALSG